MILARLQVTSLVIVVSILFFYLVAPQWLFFKTADIAVFDRQSRYLASQLKVDEDIVVIAIDDYSLKQMNAIAGR